MVNGEPVFSWSGGRRWEWENQSLVSGECRDGRRLDGGPGTSVWLRIHMFMERRQLVPYIALYSTVVRIKFFGEVANSGNAMLLSSTEHAAEDSVSQHPCLLLHDRQRFLLQYVNLYYCPRSPRARGAVAATLTTRDTDTTQNRYMQADNLGRRTNFCRTGIGLRSLREKPNARRMYMRH